MKKLSLSALGRPSVEECQSIAKSPFSVVLDNVRSLHNVGSAFRTADAFAVERLYLSGITGTPPSREIQKTALGATESVRWQYAERAADVVSALKRDGYQIVAVEQTVESVELQQFCPSPHARYCLIFGNEVDGVSNELLALSDVAIAVPQAGVKHSLNVAVCIGVVLWDFYKNMVIEQQN